MKTIQGDKVKLRPIHKDDVEILHKWINAPEVAGFWYGRDKPRSLNWVRKHFEKIIKGKDKSECWMIELESRPIGFMYNTLASDEEGNSKRRVELDIMIGEKKEWRKGFATDALRVMIKYAFEVQKAGRVFLTPLVRNKKAIDLYKKIGFKEEGVLRYFEEFEGKWEDFLMMSIIRPEYRRV